MDDLMSVKEYDLTEITKMLLKMRSNCIRKDGDTYDDPEREAKYAALNDAITLINNPSLLKPVRHGRWIPMYEEIEMLTTEGWIMRETQTAWKCSECGREEAIARDTMPYCHCGAKMDGDRL